MRGLARDRCSLFSNHSILLGLPVPASIAAAPTPAPDGSVQLWLALLVQHIGTHQQASEELCAIHGEQHLAHLALSLRQVDWKSLKSGIWAVRPGARFPDGWYTQSGRISTLRQSLPRQYDLVETGACVVVVYGTSCFLRGRNWPAVLLITQ